MESKASLSSSPNLKPLSNPHNSAHVAYKIYPITNSLTPYLAEPSFSGHPKSRDVLKTGSIEAGIRWQLNNLSKHLSYKYARVLHIKITYLNFNHLNSKKLFKKLFSSFKCLDKVKVYIKETNLNGNQLTSILRPSLGKLPQIHYFSLSLLFCAIEGKNITLKKIVQPLKNVNCFSLDVQGTMVDSDEISTIGKIVGSKNSIQNFRFNFGHSPITNERIKELERDLKKLRKLKKLNLRFGSQSIQFLKSEQLGIEPTPLTNSVNARLSNYFTFSFAKHNITDNLLGHIAEMLIRFQRLQGLTLDLTANLEITDTGIAALADAIAKLINLESLCLGLGIKIGDDGIESLGNAFDRLTNLSHFSLSTAGFFLKKAACFSEHAEFAEIPEVTFSNSLKLLEHLRDSEKFRFNAINLELDFTLSGVTDHDLKYLAIVLSGFHNLQSLSLNLTLNTGITDEGITTFAGCTSFLNKLETLNLYLSGNDKIGDNGVENLGKAFKQLTNLKQLALFMRSNYEFSETAFANTWKGLMYMQALENLRFDFKMNSKFTDKSLNTIKNSISQLKNLKTIYLCFGSCEKMISEEAIKVFTDQVKSSPSFQRLVILRDRVKSSGVF